MLIHDFGFESLVSYYFVWKFYFSNVSNVCSINNIGLRLKHTFQMLPQKNC
jgi:hypothetical protein